MIFPIYEGTDVLPWLHSLDTASNPTLSLPGPRPLLETSLLRLTFSLKNSGMPSLSGPDTKWLEPGLLVKTSATWKGWDRNLSTFLALATLILSSSDNSSIPRIAMISWRDL